MATKIRQSNITQPLDQDLDTLSLNANGSISATGDLTVGGNAAITGSLTVDGSVSFSSSNTAGTFTFGDDDKLQFGDSQDLEIYHDPTNGSIIKENGTGRLILDSENGTGISLTSGNIAKSMISATKDAAVTLYYDGSPKLATSSTGVSVTGEISASSAILSSTYPTLRFVDTDSNPDFTIVGGSGQVGFYDDTNNGYVFQIQASGAIVTGDLSVSGDFTVSGNTTFINSDNLAIEDLNIVLANGAANSAIADGAGITVDGANAQITYAASSDAWLFNKTVGIGNTSPTYKLTVEDNTGAAVNLLQLRNPTNLYNQSWSYSLDTNKDLVITGGSSIGGVVYNTGSRGFNIGGYTTGHKLTVSTNTAGDTNLLRLYAGGTATGGAGVDLKVWASDSQINITSGTNDNIQFQVDDGDALKDILMLAQDGNVGINVTAPDSQLDINGDLRVRGVDHGNSKFGLMGIRNQQGSSALGGFGMHFTSGYENPIIYGYDAGGNYADGNIRFASMQGGDRSLDTGLTDRMVVNMYTGNVGIGESSPSNRLHIKGPNTSGRGQVTIEGNGDNVDPRLSFYGFNTTSDFANTSSYGLDIFVDTSELAARYDVPTGMEQWWTIQGSPKIKLDQYGDLRAINDNYDYHIHKRIDGWDGDGSADNFLLICEVGAANVRLNGRIAAARSGSASAVFGSTHNLGFVTNNTGTVLGNYCESTSTYDSIYGASYARLVSLTYNGTNYYAFQFNGAYQDWIVDNDACHFDGHATSDVLFDVISTDLVTVSNVSLVDTEGGRKILMDQTMGIGTPIVADGSKLHISSNGGNSVYQTFTRSTGGSNAKHWRIGIDTQHEFKIERQNDDFTQGTEYFYTGPNNTRINGDLTSQSSVLRVVRQQASGSNNTYTFEVDSSAHTSNLTSAGAMAVDVSAGRALTIDGFGRVGINTSTPNSVSKLHVFGDSGDDTEVKVRIESDLPQSNEKTNAAVIDLTARSKNASGNSSFNNTFIKAEGVANYGNGAKLTFWTDDPSTAAEVKRMTIDEYGKVGIGKDTPQAQLHVLGSTRFETDSSSGGFKHYFSNTGTGGQDYWVMSTNNGNGSLLGGKFAIGTDSVSGNNAAQTRFVIDSNGNVGIGTTTPNNKLEVNGSFAATTKSFDIEHPTKEGMRLHHGSLEGPEHGVYVRGRLKDSNVIVLPDYWTGLVDEDTITVQLTAIGGKQNLWVEDIVDNSIIVGFEDKVNCFYFVQAERKDVDKFDVEYVNGE
jgi:hypothetical protein